LDTITGSAPGTGPRPDSIRVQSSDVEGVDEMFSALLRFPGGITAALHSGFNAQFRMASEIVGTKGALEVPLTFLGNAGPMILTTGDQRQEIPVPESDRYQLQLEDFAAAILEKRPPLLTPEETVRNLELIDRLYAAR
jgi:predicted dehydrogenase